MAKADSIRKKYGVPYAPLSEAQISRKLVDFLPYGTLEGERTLSTLGIQ